MNGPYLTKNQLRFYDFLKDFFRRERRWPIYDEIMAHFNWSSPNSVARGLKRLVEKGYLDKTDYGTYQFTEKEPGKTDVPAYVLDNGTQEKGEA